MSNAERRVQNEEVEIRRTYDSRITTNKVLSLGSRFWILFNVECPTPIEEFRIGKQAAMLAEFSLIS